MRLRKVLAVMVVAVMMLTAHLAWAGEGVGVLWAGKSGMAKRVVKGFMEGMKEKAPDIDIEYNAELQDMDAAAAVYDKWQDEKAAIVFLRSTGARHMGENPPKVPGFVGGCSNPAELGAVSDFQKPDKNITGVTYYLPAELQIQMLQKVFPDMKSVGLMLEKGHPAAAVDRKETQAACEAAGLEYFEAICADEKELLAGAKDLSQKADVLIVGNQALIIDNAAKAAKFAGGKPLASYAEKPVATGAAVCGLVPDDEKLGAMLADSVVAVLEEGKSVSEVPVKTDPEPRLVVSDLAARKAGVEIPQELLEKAEVVR